MAVDPVQLKAEIRTDPKLLGYDVKAVAGDEIAISGLLNALVGAGAASVVREPISTPLLFTQIAPADFSALTAIQLQQLQVIFTMPTINLGDANTRAILAAIFPPASATRASLVSLANRTGSRAEVLFGTGTIISPSDVSFALRGAR